jgi:hypothetical protein
MFGNPCKRQLKTLKDAPVPKERLERARRALLVRMAERPLPERAVRGSAFLSALKPALAVFAVVLFSGAGVVSAAQGALPGETLYGVKLLSEEAGARLLISNGARLRFRAMQAERRLDEMEKIIVVEKKPPAARRRERVIEAAAKFEAHVEKMNALRTASEGDGERAERAEETFKRVRRRHDRLIDSASAAEEEVRALLPKRRPLRLDLELDW